MCACRGCLALEGSSFGWLGCVVALCHSLYVHASARVCFGSTFVERVAMLAFANREPDKNRGFGFTRSRDMP